MLEMEISEAGKGWGINVGVSRGQIVAQGRVMWSTNLITCFRGGISVTGGNSSLELEIGSGEGPSSLADYWL